MGGYYYLSSEIIFKAANVFINNKLTIYDFANNLKIIEYLMIPQ